MSGSFISYVNKCTGGLNPIAFFFPHLPIPPHWKRDRARERVTQIFKSFIKSRRNRPESEPKPDDMLQNLMESEYKGGVSLDDATICGLLIGLLFAGRVFQWSISYS